MRIRLKHQEQEEQLHVEAGTRIADVLQQKKLNRQTFLIKRNGRLAHEETELMEGDVVECWNVVYGG